MDTLAIDLYGNLIITFLALTTPFLIFLMNISRENVRSFEKTLTSSIDVMKGELSSIASIENQDTGRIKLHIKKVEGAISMKKVSLNLLNPKRQILRTFMSLLGSFLLLESYLTIKIVETSTIYIRIAKYGCLVLSVIAFIAALWIVWQILKVLIELRGKVTDKSYDDTRISPKPTRTDG